MIASRAVRRCPRRRRSQVAAAAVAGFLLAGIHQPTAAQDLPANPERDALLHDLTPQAIAEFQRTFRPRTFAEPDSVPPYTAQPTDEQRKTLDVDMHQFEIHMADDPDKALAGLDDAVGISSLTFGENHPQTTTYKILKANLLNRLGRYAQAESLSNEAVSTLSAIAASDYPELSAARIELCAAAAGNDQWVLADQACVRASRDSISALGFDSPQTAHALEALYFASSHFDLHDQDTLFSDLKSAADVVPAIRATSEVIWLDRIGYYLTHHRFEQAQTLLRDTSALDASWPDPSQRDPTHIQNLYASLYILTGHPDKAIAIFDMLLAIPGLPQKARVTFLMNKAQALATSGDDSNADTIFRQALAQATGDSGRTHVVLAWAQRLIGRGKYLEALEAYEGVLKTDLKETPPALKVNSPDSAQMAAELGMIYQGLGRLDLAEPLYDKASAYDQSRGEVVFDYATQMAYLYAQTHRMPGALAKARDLVRQLNGQSRADSRGGAAPLSLSTFSLDSQNSQDTSFVYKALADLLDQDAGANRRARSAAAAEVFEAFQGAMLSPAAVSVRLAAAGKQASAAQAALARQYQHAATLLERADSDLADAQSTGKPADLIADLARQEQVLAEKKAALGKQLRDIYPAYADLVSPAPMSLERVKARIAPGEALVLIMPVRDDNFVFVVTKTGGLDGTGVDWHRIPQAVERTRRNVTNVLCHIDERVYCSDGLGGDLSKFDTAAAFGLYQDTLAQFREQLNANDVTHIYTSSAGDLARIPLNLLMMNAPAPGADLRDDNWIGKHYSLTSLPSVSSLELLATPAGDNAGEVPFVGYGDPSLDDTRQESAEDGLTWFTVGRSGDVVADGNRLRRLGRLPGTGKELSDVNTALNGHDTRYLHTGLNDDEGLFRTDPATAAASVISIATHGLLPGSGDALQEGALVFTPPANPTTVDDGLLTSSEIAQMNLKAKWVVLSACDTATADGASDSLSSLARAFIFAGSQGVLASHWRIDDAATAELVRLTLTAYAGAAADHKPISRARALQLAMDALRQNKNHRYPDKWQNPAFWAPFDIISGAEQ